MALTEFETALAEVITSEYVAGRRPPEQIRHEVDLAFKIHGQSVVLYEIRPHPIDSKQRLHLDFAKTTYTRTTKIWKIYWLRANGNWEGYRPCPEVGSLEEFLQIVEDDRHGCFRG